MNTEATRPDAVLLMGPTASGKSAVAMRIADAFPVEIVSVDSAQVYRDMTVGTAKPTVAERERVPHHLIDIMSPVDRYSAASFARDAHSLIEAIQARGRIPLLVGGTMLYFRALTQGLDALPEANAEVRADIDARATQVGWPALHRELADVDQETAARLNPNDRQRIQRALEVFRITGQPLSSLLKQTTRPTASTTQYLSIALVPCDRAVLHRRIAERFERMLSAGLVDEVRTLRDRYPDLTADLPSMRAVGYRQALEHLDGAYDATELRARGIYATRQLAKRQLTWLRAMRAEAATTFDALDDGVERKVIERIASAFGS